MISCLQHHLVHRVLARWFLTIGWSDRGARLRWAKEGVDDWDKVPSADAGKAPRRSTSSLAATLTSQPCQRRETIGTSGSGGSRDARALVTTSASLSRVPFPFRLIATYYGFRMAQRFLRTATLLRLAATID